MFIVWGKKPVNKRLGYVADFCPMCRDLRVFKVKRVGMASHVYYISFGEGELVGHVNTCATCDIDLDCKPETYRQLHDRKLAPAQLAELTYPQWKEAWASRLAAERELKNPFGKLSPEWRQVLLREPFRLLSGRVEQRFSASQIDWPTIGALAGLLVLLWAASTISQSYPSVSDGVWWTAWILGLAGIASQVWMIKSRYFRSKIFPVLIPALRPLKPTLEELDATLKELKSHGRKIGKMMKAKDIMAAMEGQGELPEHATATS
jgi:hypothetical protein